MQKPFEMTMNGGIVHEVFVSDDTTIEDENLLKGILGALQFDTRHKSTLDEKSFFRKKASNGVYRKMEHEVSGECEVLMFPNILTPLHL